MADDVTEPGPSRSEAVEVAPPSVRRLAREVRARSTNLRATLAAIAAWAITLAPLAVSGRASLATRLIALLALAPGVAGPQLLARGDRIARHVGVTAFVAAALAAWTLGSLDQALVGVDSFRAVLGVIAWAVFALSWPHPWSVPDEKLSMAPEGEAAGLTPRRKPPVVAVVVAGVGAACGAFCLALAWRVEDPSRAVFAHAAAVGAAVALLTSASTVAVVAGREHRREGRRPRLPINRKVFNNLILMALVVALAIAVRYT
jgi:hypothetical protein